MKKNPVSLVLTALLISLTPLGAAPTVFFSDNFANGSTVNSATPVSPTTNSASYEVISSLALTATNISPNDLRYGFGNSGGNICEIQALFSTNAIALTEPGDFIQLTIVFTNLAGIYTNPASGALTAVGFGLYNSGSGPAITNFPIAGGMTTEGAAPAVSGGVQNWAGYMAFASDTTSSLHNQIYARPAQGVQVWDQDLVTQGSSTKSFSGNNVAGNTGLTIGSAGATLVPASNSPQVYTNVLTITLVGATQLAITNNLYNSSGLVDSLGGTNTAAAYTGASFDGLAMGFYKKSDPASVLSNVVDVASITVSGSVTIISGPPTITLQPTNVLVPNGAAGAFIVNAQGFNTTYQWHRNGTNLDSGGNISVINSVDGTSSILAISSASIADVASTYYVTVSGAGGFSTNSITNSLSLTIATNLVWNGNSTTWNLDNTVSWNDPNSNQTTFNFGDAVTFDPTGGGGSVVLTGPYLSASSVTVNESGFPYTFSGSGSFAGPGALYFYGSSQLNINNANTYSGGTVISNATGNLILGNISGLGTGPVILETGTLEWTVTGSSSSGIAGDLVVAGGSSIIVTNQFDGNGTYAGVFYGNLSGASGNTLALTAGASVTNVDRIRISGTNTVYNGNLILASSYILYAPYNSSGSQTYNGLISGPGTIIQKGNYMSLNYANTFAGGVELATGDIGLGVDSVGSPGSVTAGPVGTGALLLTVDSSSQTTGSGEIDALNGARTLANPVQNPSGTNNFTLIIGGTNNLTLSGAFQLNGNDNLTAAAYTNRTVQVTNTGLTTISGVISDGGLNYGFNKTGSGVLALNNTETYTGPTLISGGTLSVNGTLNVASAVTATNGILGGTGTINGPVTIQNGGGIAPGNSIGTLTINNSLTIQGGSTNNFEVNKTASTHDLITGLTSVTYGGTLFATNLAGTITTSDTFQIFSAAAHSGNFTNIIGSPGAGLAWTFNPSAGTLGVVQSVATNPTNIIFSVSGNTLNLSWPADHTGWILQVQTNSLATGLQTNSGAWFNVPGSDGVDSTNFTINPANGCVFYRLISP